MEVVTIGPAVLSTAVLLVLGGVLAANGVAGWFRRRCGADPGPLLWKMMLSGFVAARAVFVLRHHDLFLARPFSALDFRDGGFDPMAGLLVACLVGAGLAGRQDALRRPLMAATAAGVAVWLGGTVLLQALAPPQAPLPDLLLRRLDGTQVALRSYQGKPLVVNLWATWCPPCRREMPALGAMQAARPDVAFVFVNQGESATVVARYLAAQGLRMQNVVTDPAGQLAARTGAAGFPTTLFYDAGGMLRGRHVGELSEATVRERLSGLGP